MKTITRFISNFFKMFTDDRVKRYEQAKRDVMRPRFMTQADLDRGHLEATKALRRINNFVSLIPR